MRRARSAKGRAHSQLALTGEGARQQQVGDVRARHQQHERDGTEEDDDDKTHVSDDLIEQRHDREREAAVRRIHVGEVAAETRSERVHLGLRLGDRHAGLQPGHDVVVFARACGRRRVRQRKRQEHVAVFHHAERWQHFARQPERLRHHADHLVADAIKNDRLSDNPRNSTEAARPEAMAQNGGGRASRRIVFRHEELPVKGSGAEHGQQIRRHANYADAFGIAAACQIEISPERDRDLFQAAVRGLDIEVLGCGKPVFLNVEARRPVPEDGQPVGIAVI